MTRYTLYDYQEFYSLFHTPKKTDGPRLCLGKKFATNIRKEEAWRINNYRMRLEEIKLKIIDAAEQGKRPPLIEDAEWLHQLFYHSPELKFVWKEFEEWMILNGLDAVFKGCSTNRTMQILLSTSINIGTAEELENNGQELLIKHLKPRGEV